MLFLVIIITIKQSCHALNHWECQIQNECFPNVSSQINRRLLGKSGTYWLRFDFSLSLLFYLCLHCQVVKLFHHKQETCAWWHSRCGAHVFTKCLFINLISSWAHRLLMEEPETEEWSLQIFPSRVATISQALLSHLSGWRLLSFIPVLTSYPFLLD